MSPGAYLRKRREAAGLTLADVAARVVTEPRMPEHERAEWLRLLETDAMPPSARTIAVLRQVEGLRFSGEVLDRLIDLDYFDAKLPAPPICPLCGCSWFDPCHGDQGAPEHRWIPGQPCQSCELKAQDLAA